jgi:hypothetical protein
MKPAGLPSLTADDRVGHGRVLLAVSCSSTTWPWPGGTR